MATRTRSVAREGVKSTPLNGKATAKATAKAKPVVKTRKQDSCTLHMERAGEPSGKGGVRFNEVGFDDLAGPERHAFYLSQTKDAKLGSPATITALITATS